MDAVAERLQSFSRHLQRRRIQVQPEQFAIGRRGLKDAEGVPPCPDGSVDVASARLRLQAAYYFFVKNRNVHVGRRMTIDDCYWLFATAVRRQLPLPLVARLRAAKRRELASGSFMFFNCSSQPT